MPTSSPSTSTLPYEVVVCSYNGEAYILDQLTSIVRQQPAPAAIIVSDDGSTDDTLDIVERFAQVSAVPVRQITGPNQGIIRNTFQALKHTSAPYVFLADQDDIWLENKAPLFCTQMRETNEPHLIFSDAWVWSPESEERRSFWRVDGLIPKNAQNPRRLAFHNTVQGASACINRALIDALVYDSRIVMHDWWLALIAAGTGSVSTIIEPTLLYRQHASNQVGIHNKGAGKKGKLWHRRKVAVRILRQAQAFAEYYGHKLEGRNRRFFGAYRRALNGNILHRAWFVMRYWPQHKSIRHILTLWASIVLAGGAAKQ